MSSLQKWSLALATTFALALVGCDSPLDEPLGDSQQKVSAAELDGVPTCDRSALRSWAESLDSRLEAYELDDEGLAAVVMDGQLVCIDETSAITPYASLHEGTPLPAKLSSAQEGTPLPAKR